MDLRSGCRWFVVALFCVLPSASLAQDCWVCSDWDGDGACDFQDNCLVDPNGPWDPPEQYDADLDGFGNLCDTDYDGDGNTTTADFGIFFESFTGAAPTPVTDHDGDGATTTVDFGTFYAYFSDPASPTPPGPSGYPCAGYEVPCLAPPDPPGGICD